MPRLRDVTKVLRSKNAGPFMLTFDLLFNSAEELEKAVAADVFDARLLAPRLGCTHNEIAIHVYRPANAVKITIPRPHPSGSFDDTDVFGCQQHAVLLDLELPAGGT
jgi:hypothetical protein